MPTAITIRPSTLWIPLALWVVMAVLAVINGAFRETVLTTRFTDTTAHRISTLLLVVAILTVAAAYFTTTTTTYTNAELLLIGGVWTVLTVGFEFLVGYLENTPVSETIAQYDIFAGEVWILVPITLFVAPYLFGSLITG